MAFSFVYISTKSKSGFTLIELLVVVAIIGVLSTMVAFVATEMIRRAKVARAQGDLGHIAKAIRQLELDTGYTVNKESLNTCTASGGLGGATNEVIFSPGDISMERSGLYTNFTPALDSWKGPYMDGSITEVNLDPWGKPYMYDGDYQCVENVKGCERYVGGATNDRAVTSFGPDKTEYTSDDIVIVFCGST